MVVIFYWVQGVLSWEGASACVWVVRVFDLVPSPEGTQVQTNRKAYQTYTKELPVFLYVNYIPPEMFLEPYTISK